MRRPADFENLSDSHGEAAKFCRFVSASEGFGDPHVHSGLGIRKLGGQLYECRAGLDWRLVFEIHKGVLTLDFRRNA